MGSFPRKKEKKQKSVSEISREMFLTAHFCNSIPENNEIKEVRKSYFCRNLYIFCKQNLKDK